MPEAAPTIALPQPQGALPYRREVDGLRAIAIVPVMLFHAGFETLSGGFVGVDVFFVISGYLITSIMLREMAQGRYSLLGFYERRARRILPALLVVLAACVAAAWAGMLPRELQRFGQSLVSVQLFGSNIYFWQTTDYFSPAAEQLPLLHTWSLAVEEQYYLLFPLLMMLCQRGGLRLQAAATLACAALSLALAQWGAAHYPIANFYLLPTRAWELLAGSLLAMGLPVFGRGRPVPPAMAQAGGVAGLAMILAAVLLFNRDTPFPSVHALLPVVGTCLIIAFASRQTWVGKLLSTAPMVAIGLISYSAYLWHQPVLVFARYLPFEPGAAWSKAALVVLALLLAAFSWWVIERPFRERRLLAGRAGLFIASLAGMVLFGALGLALDLHQGFPGRGQAEALQNIDSPFPGVDKGWCFYSVDTLPQLPVGPQGLGCVLGDRSAARRGLLVGDSFAGQYEPFWDLLGKRAGLAIAAVTTNWCFPSLGERYTGPPSSPAYRQCGFNRRHVVAHWHDHDFVVVAADWRNLLRQDMLADATAFIDEALRQGLPVIVMPTPTRLNPDVLLRAQRAAYFGRSFDSAVLASPEDAQAVEGNHRLRAYCAGKAGVIFLDRPQVFQVDGVASDLTADKLSYSFDGRHLSVYGALAAGEQFARSDDFRRILALVDGGRKPAGQATAVPLRP